MSQEKIQIRLSVLTEQIEAGWKLKPLAEHYGIPVSRMRDILKSADLRIRSFRGPQIELVDDTKDKEEGKKEELPEVVESVKDTNEVSTEELPEIEEEGPSEIKLEEDWNLDISGSGDSNTEESNNNNLTPNYTF